MANQIIEQRFNVPAAAHLSLSNVAGTVEIVPGEDGVLTVTAEKLAPGDAEHTEIRLTQAADGSVVAETHYTQGWWMWAIGKHPCAVAYKVTAPRQCSLKVSCVSSTAQAAGFEGTFDFNTVSGDLSLADLNGPMKFHTVSGNVAAERLNGKLDVNTVSGDLDLQNSTLTAIDATSVSGTLHLQTPLAGGPFRFSSVSGDVELLVPTETHCTLELSTISGDITTSLPATTLHRQRGSQVVEIQGGGPHVRLSSVSGNLRVGDNSTGNRPTPDPVASTPTLSRQEILDRIERGEITVAEGIQQLNG